MEYNEPFPVGAAAGLFASRKCQSVDPPFWDKNFEAYTSGRADQSSYDPGPLPSISLYLPLEWQHGAQWGPEDLKEGLRLENVLPGASQPGTNLILQGVNYTATIGPASYESYVFLRPTE
ncbi:hypothetical protein CQ14_41245 [Bradyrhizobium lablabi]|uniref:Uncharacterized protein n=1 Tax=Bradyrhizobium lablabi TaxID=722472 RepID=A0A0R3NEA2_9BRAD|nr:hypothetical protein CQ14_41245 [Bradyrhizobium lablabi]